MTSTNPTNPTPDIATSISSDPAKSKNISVSNNNKGGFKRLNNVKLPARFEGRCADLKGHIYNCSDSRKTDQFAKTTREIAEYFSSKYKNAGDIRAAIIDLNMRLQMSQVMLTIVF